MIIHSPHLSRVPGLRHGFSTRVGGVSEGPYATLDLGAQLEARPDAVAENRRRFLAEVGGEVPLALADAHQVHGTRVLRVSRAGPQGSDADGLLTDAPLVAVAVRTADCAPVLLAALDDRGCATHVAAVHAGWRGATGGIVREAVAALCDAAEVRATRLVAAIGPTIGVEHFEVGDEVVDAARASLDGDAPPTRAGAGARLHLDLVALLVAHLSRAGVPAAQVDAVGGSTFDAVRYFSHRRDHGVTGRHLSAIALVPESARQ